MGDRVCINDRWSRIVFHKSPSTKPAPPVGERLSLCKHGLGCISICEQPSEHALPGRTSVRWLGLDGTLLASLNLHDCVVTGAFVVANLGCCMVITSDGICHAASPVLGRPSRAPPSIPDWFFSRLPGVIDCQDQHDGTICFLTDDNDFIAIEPRHSAFYHIPMPASQHKNEPWSTPTHWKLCRYGGSELNVVYIGADNVILHRVAAPSDAGCGELQTSCRLPDVVRSDLRRMAVSSDGSSVALLLSNGDILLYRGYEFEQRQCLRTKLPVGKASSDRLFAFVDNNTLACQLADSLHLLPLNDLSPATVIPVSSIACMQVLLGGHVLVLEPQECSLLHASGESVENELQLAPLFALSRHQTALLQLDLTHFCMQLGHFDGALEHCQSQVQRRAVQTDRILAQPVGAVEEHLDKCDPEQVDIARIVRHLHPSHRKLALRVWSRYSRSIQSDESISLLIALGEYGLASQHAKPADFVKLVHKELGPDAVLPLLIELNLLKEPEWSRALEVAASHDVSLTRDLLMLDDRYDELAMFYLGLGLSATTIRELRDMEPMLTWAGDTVREKMVLVDTALRHNMPLDSSLEDIIQVLHGKGAHGDVRTLSGRLNLSQEVVDKMTIGMAGGRPS